ncbi:MAG TPA: DUF4279 domain-containing protein [Candidatus Acidoferrum sp.]|nr:DUF4279 domain-containing protein [Candidatus Acidoferrum sp.]
MGDEIEVRLSIISDHLSAAHVDEQLGIRCDESRVRGELNRLGTKPYDHHAWFLKTGYQVDPSEYIGDKIANQIDEILSRVASVVPKIRELGQENYVEVALYLYARDVPPLGLSKEHIKAIAELGAHFDVDLVLYVEESQA